MSVLSRFVFRDVPILFSVSRAAVAMVALACCGVSFCSVSLATEPGNDEQFMLELVNRMRMNPQGELDLLVNINQGPPATFANPSSAEPATRNALSFFNVNAATLLSQWQQLTPVQPLAAILTTCSSYSKEIDILIMQHFSQMVAGFARIRTMPSSAPKRPNSCESGYKSSSTSDG